MDLSSEQKAAFDSNKRQSCHSPPDIHDVMRLMAEIDRRVAGNVSGGRCFGTRLINVLEAVQRFAALGDIITDESIRHALANLPRDLPGTFSRILNQSAALGKEDQRRTLELITAACRPLTTDELQEALSVVPGDPDWNPSRMLNDVYAALACCGSVVIVDEETLLVKLIHHSVKQFLLSGPEGMAGQTFTIQDANKTMAGVIMTYLDYAVVRLLLKRGANPYLRDTDGRTPLSWAAEGGHETVVRLLVEKGADIESKDDGGRTPLWWAAQNGHKAVIWLLLEKDANANSRDTNGRTPLSRAAEGGHEAMVRLLLVNGAAIESKDTSSGWTLLWWAT
ncbi:hypothetical protein FOXYS1_2916 [Fusarium oxysporum]|uniref:GPI inositol-deacylase winged helix domain-containing protein n=1 Tax=Fusarium oxysporum TaxID=5507 RepID=A0A8H5AIX7_FUSOX|nr:hypothetical protein FOXYS1_2916 [Fusarium oxysporum]